MVMPSSYPHGMDDDELEHWLQHLMDQVSTTDMNTVFMRAPLIQAGQAEQQRRAIAKLHKTVADFDTSSRESAGRLAFATWVLVGITVLLLGATIALTVYAAK